MSFATVFIAFYQLAPAMNWLLLWSPVTFALGYVVFAFCAPKLSREIESGETLHGYLGNAYSSPSLRFIAALMTSIGLLGVFAVELIVACHVFGAIFGGNEATYYLSLGILFITIVAYSVLGGFKGILENDLPQTILILLLIGVLLYIGYSGGGVSASQKSLPALTWGGLWVAPLFILNLMLINVPFPLVDMQGWQRVVAAKDAKSTKSAILWAALFFFVTWGLILVACILLPHPASGGPISGFDVMLRDFAMMGMANTLLVAIGFLGIAAAIMANADTALIAAGQALSMDVFDAPFFASSAAKAVDDSAGSSRENGMRVVSRARLLMVLCASASLLISLGLVKVGFGVADLVFAIFGSALALLPAVLAAMFLKGRLDLSRLNVAAWLSSVLGFLSGWGYGTAMVLTTGPSYNAPMVSLIVASVIFALGALLTKITKGGSS
jgi:Na+/proline symporter